MTIEDLKAYQDMKRTVRELEERLQMVYEASPKPNENPGGRSSVRTSSDPTAAKANNAIEIQAELEAVQVIRCKDCKYFRPDDDCDQCALWEYGKTDREAFCSYAMRRGEE